jgi:hypothetical protein
MSTCIYHICDKHKEAVQFLDKNAGILQFGPGQRNWEDTGIIVGSFLMAHYQCTTCSASEHEVPEKEFLFLEEKLNPEVREFLNDCAFTLWTKENCEELIRKAFTQDRWGWIPAIRYRQIDKKEDVNNINLNLFPEE